MPNNALEIESGAELEKFLPDFVEINGRDYIVLTGYEGTGRCFWCGGELKGKLKRYCRGHMLEYYRHFEWSSARQWCGERQEWRCANCGKQCDASTLEVHHIVPLKGEKRFISAFNLPWNLIGFCHACHQEVHAAMRPPPKNRRGRDPWEEAGKVGQAIMPLFGQQPPAPTAQGIEPLPEAQKPVDFKLRAS